LKLKRKTSHKSAAKDFGGGCAFIPWFLAFIEMPYVSVYYTVFLAEVKLSKTHQTHL